MINLTCPYCGSPAKLVDSKVIYGGRGFGLAWVCENFPACDAYVGCHPETDKPLGRLADKELRVWKRDAHTAFDGIWKVGGMRRKHAYAWLAKQLGIQVEDCHIGMFDVQQCKAVVDASNRWGTKL